MDECLYKVSKGYIMIELTFLKEFMLIKQVHQKSVTFYHYWYFLNYSLKFQPNVCNRCHDLLLIYVNLAIAISKIKVSDYRCIFSLICKKQTTSLLQNADLTKKSGTLKILKK